LVFISRNPRVNHIAIFVAGRPRLAVRRPLATESKIAVSSTSAKILS